MLPPDIEHISIYSVTKEFVVVQPIFISSSKERRDVDPRGDGGIVISGDCVVEGVCNFFGKVEAARVAGQKQGRWKRNSDGNERLLGSTDIERGLLSRSRGRSKFETTIMFKLGDALITHGHQCVERGRANGQG